MRKSETMSSTLKGAIAKLGERGEGPLTRDEQFDLYVAMPAEPSWYEVSEVISIIVDRYNTPLAETIPEIKRFSYWVARNAERIRTGIVPVDVVDGRGDISSAAASKMIRAMERYFVNGKRAREMAFAKSTASVTKPRDTVILPAMVNA